MVSIVMPAYNAAGTIRLSVESVLAQTVSDWELIVIDDGSSDDTAEILAQMAARDRRIRFLQNERNSGASYTRNRAVALAEGEWIAFLDSDDLWHPQKLEKQLTLAAEHPDMVICYTASSFINDDGNPYPYRIMKIGDKRAITIAPICDELFNRPISELVKFLKDELAEKIFEYADTHPEIVKEYDDMYPVLMFER